ncbi:MAG: ATP synthase F1 subunit delta [Phycisphaerae bacterium]|nr:ATP synthase F1 subunit delta [Phycisphaerae bacterium]
MNMDINARHETVLDPTVLRLGDLYAQALLESLPAAQADAVADELDALEGAMDTVPGARDLLLGFLGRSEDRTRRLERVFAGRVSERVEALLGVLERHGRLTVLPAVIRSFRRRLNDKMGRVAMTLTTAVPLDAAELAEIRASLAASLGVEPMLQTRVDETLIGGAVLRVGDQVFDSSVKNQLEQLRKNIARKSQ